MKAPLFGEIVVNVADHAAKLNPTAELIMDTTTRIAVPQLGSFATAEIVKASERGTVIGEDAAGERVEYTLREVLAAMFELELPDAT